MKTILEEGSFAECFPCHICLYRLSAFLSYTPWNQWARRAPSKSRRTRPRTNSDACMGVVPPSLPDAPLSFHLPRAHWLCVRTTIYSLLPTPCRSTQRPPWDGTPAPLPAPRNVRRAISSLLMPDPDERLRDKIIKTRKAAAGIPVTASSTKDEVRSVSFGAAFGRVGRNLLANKNHMPSFMPTGHNGVKLPPNLPSAWEIIILAPFASGLFREIKRCDLSTAHPPADGKHAPPLPAQWLLARR